MSDLTAGLWVEREDPVTGESSLKTHKPRLIQQICETHKESVVKDWGKRTATCKECGQEINFVLGRDKVEGNIVFA